MSDTNGVTLDPYMRVLLRDLKTQWQNRLQKQELKVTANADASVVDLTISTDGKLAALRLEPSGSAVFDKAAWDAAKSIQYPALPTGMKNANLKLHVEFFAN